MGFEMKKLVVIVLAVILSIGIFPAFALSSATTANGAPLLIWGVDPTESDGELVCLDALTGNVYARFDLNNVSTTDVPLGLAGSDNQLYFVNGDVSDGTVYLISPSNGAEIGTVTLENDCDIDGLAYFDNGEGSEYLFTSGCVDVRRYSVAGGTPTSWIRRSRRNC